MNKWISIAWIAAVTMLGLAFMSISKPPPELRVRVDTLRVVTTVYDTVTVISKAADTVRITVKEVGPLTQADLVRLICSEGWLNDGSGLFNFNAYGMVFCPAKEDK